MREREVSTSIGRGMRGGGVVSAGMNDDEDEKVIKYNREQYQDQ